MRSLSMFGQVCLVFGLFAIVARADVPPLCGMSCYIATQPCPDQTCKSGKFGFRLCSVSKSIQKMGICGFDPGSGIGCRSASCDGIFLVFGGKCACRRPLPDCN